MNGTCSINFHDKNLLREMIGIGWPKWDKIKALGCARVATYEYCTVEHFMIIL